MRRLLVTDQAQLDIHDVVAWSDDSFGQVASRRYAELIEQSLFDLRLDPMRPGVHHVHEIGPQVYLYRIEFSRRNVSGRMGRVKRARHVVVFQIEADGSIIVNRFMHESMNLRSPLDRSGQ